MYPYLLGNEYNFMCTNILCVCLHWCFLFKIKIKIINISVYIEYACTCMCVFVFCENVLYMCNTVTAVIVVFLKQQYIVCVVCAGKFI